VIGAFGAGKNFGSSARCCTLVLLLHCAEGLEKNEKLADHLISKWMAKC
jgi:hypothetical protein